MEAGKSGFGERCKTIHDLWSHSFGGSVISNCVLTTLLSCVCVFFWYWNRPHKRTEIDRLTGSHRLEVTYGHFLFSRVFSHSLVEFRDESAYNVEIRARCWLSLCIDNVLSLHHLQSDCRALLLKK